MNPSEEYKSLYKDMYSGGQERAWRDAGAICKAANIERAWAAAGTAMPRVVEIGCGEGAVADRLAGLQFFSEYVGFDLSPSGVEEAKSRQIADAHFELVTGSSLPAADDSADVVILTHVVEHLEHPRELIAEARRIAPWLIVEVPLEMHSRTPHDYDWNPVGHINKFGPKAIRHLVQTCQFEVVTQFTTNPSRETAIFFDNSLKRRLSWRT